VVATNTGDCPNLFSNFFSDINDDFSSSIPASPEIFLLPSMNEYQSTEARHIISMILVQRRRINYY